MVIKNNKAYEIKVQVEELNTDTLNVTVNGQYTPTSPVDAFDEVNVNVQPNLETLNATENDTYTPTNPVQGYSSVTVNVQPNPYSEYLTGYYIVNRTDTNLTILNTTSNVSGWRIKGVTTWETPVTSIPVTECGVLVIEFNLTNNTQCPNFIACDNLFKIEFPSTITTIQNSAFFDTKLQELPPLDNITSIDGDAFYRCPFNHYEYILNDNVTRNYNIKAFNNDRTSCVTTYLYTNGILYRLFDDGDISFSNVTELDFTNGVNGLTVNKWWVSNQTKKHTLKTIKLPSTVTDISTRTFAGWTVENVYFNTVTPPTVTALDGQTIFYDSNVTNIYVPAEGLTAYQNSSDFADVASKIQAMP